MMDFLAIAYNYEKGKRNGSILAIVAFVLFLIFFKPLVWVIKVTGIFSLLQWMQLIDSHGDFSFVALFVYMIGLVVLLAAISIVHGIFSAISDFLIGLGNK